MNFRQQIDPNSLLTRNLNSSLTFHRQIEQPIFSLPGPGLGFPKHCVAYYSKEDKAFKIRFSPPVNFSTPTSSNPYWFVSLKRVCIRHTAANSDVLEQLYSNPVGLYCENFENKLLGPLSFQRPLIDVIVFSPPASNVLSTCIYTPPSAVVPGSNSSRYNGPSICESLSFFLDFLPGLNSGIVKPTDQFPHNSIESGILEINCYASHFMHGIYN